ncbi:MAG: glycosyl transferase family 51 [Herbaspirillum sp.]|nr:glycosyl transferase family 51 [Herbaspirillum sp.]
MRSAKFIISAAILLAIAAAAWLVAQELRTSHWQAHYLARLGRQLSFHVEPGPSPSIPYPSAAPYDWRMGYAQLPDYLQRLNARGYLISAQARISPRMAQLLQHGLYAPYLEKNGAGLSILDCEGRLLYDRRYPQRTYAGFDAVPPLLTDALLYIENKALLDPTESRRNPAIEWRRLSHAAWDRSLHLFNSGHESPGGSTLATQIEKYRHSPEGRTGSAGEKLRQMASASVRAYLRGEDTMPARRQLVVDYLNTVPLGARAGYGEVNGIGDGLWAWYGRDFAQINGLLAPDSTAPLPQRALAYKEALSLLISQRRPSYYLARIDELEAMTNSYIRLMADNGVIAPSLRDAALGQSIRQQKRSTPPPQQPSSERKGVNAMRAEAAALLGVPRMYDLDRLDLTVDGTLDAPLQQQVADQLRALRRPERAAAAGLIDRQLLEHGDPSGLTYSFTLFERTPGGNRVRVQADNFDQPLDINKGIKLDLGSTAKLRTMITYLEIVADLHKQYADSDPRSLKQVEVARQDTIKLWALDYLARAKGVDRSLPAMLNAALERRYSGSPGEWFATGGGMQRFANFEKSENFKMFSVREGLRYSVNLVFVRLMRDVVHYYMYQTPDTSARLLEDGDDPQRQAYLQYFADREGKVFVSRFYRKYHGKSAAAAERALMQDVRRPTPARLAVIFRSIAPDAGPDELGKFIAAYLPAADPDQDELDALYRKYSPQSFDLPDRGYLAGVHPLELWTAAYLRVHPSATLAQVFEASSAQRQEVYRWLFKTRRKHAQDKRIRQLFEIKGFQKIHQAWQRMGYPFDSLVPSYGTAIGASADRPDALAQLMGILQNDGVRLPSIRIDTLHFAAATPYETVLTHQVGAGVRVLPPEIAQAVRPVLAEVVQMGTAKRIATAFTLPDGTRIAIGGKTGTGDNRFKTFSKGGGLLSEKVVSRSGAFVFYLGDRYFGTVVAYVAGPKAAQYQFTSALTVQILKVLAPTLMRGLYGDGGHRLACAAPREGAPALPASPPPAIRRMPVADQR